MTGDDLFREFMGMPDKEKEVFAKRISLLQKRDRDRWLADEKRAEEEVVRLLRRVMNDRTTK